jgi:hypothetical protein
MGRTPLPARHDSGVPGYFAKLLGGRPSDGSPLDASVLCVKSALLDIPRQSYFVSRWTLHWLKCERLVIKVAAHWLRFADLPKGHIDIGAGRTGPGANPLTVCTTLQWLKGRGLIGKVAAGGLTNGAEFLIHIGARAP